MSNIYNWEVTILDTAPSLDGLEKVVIGAGWYVEAKDDTPDPVKADLIGYTKFEAASPASFTPYESLTKAQVLKWIWETEDAKQKVEEHLDQQILEKKNPAVLNLPLPWPSNAPSDDTPRNPFFQNNA